MIKKLNILFRTSGGSARNKDLGMGHIFRCINLASHLKIHNLFFLIEDYGKVESTIKNYGFQNITCLPKNLDLKLDTSTTIDFIEKKSIDIIIVDKYDVDKFFIKSLHKKQKTVCISDLRKIDYDANLVINGFIGFKNHITKNQFNSRCLLGPKYQILNNNYEKIKQKKNPEFDILATFGGFDENNLIDFFCKILEPYLNNISIKIILGPATKKSKFLKNLEKKYQKNITILPETKEMMAEIMSCRYCFCSGGITTYELAVMSVPFAILCQYEHQKITAREWSKRNISTNLGMPGNLAKIKIEKILNELLNEQISTISKKQTSIDGQGAKRISLEIEKL